MSAFEDKVHDLVERGAREYEVRAAREALLEAEAIIKMLLRSLHGRVSKKDIADRARAFLGLEPGAVIECSHWDYRQATGTDGVTRRFCHWCSKTAILRPGGTFTEWKTWRQHGRDSQ